MNNSLSEPPIRVQNRSTLISYISVHNLDLHFQTNTKHVDHQAEAYVAPRRVMAEANGNSIVEANGSAKVRGLSIFQALKTL